MDRMEGNNSTVVIRNVNIPLLAMAEILIARRKLEETEDLINTMDLL